MNYLACAQEFYNLVDVGIVRQAQNIVIGRASLLLRGEILNKIRDRVGFGLNISRSKRRACRALRIYRVSVVNVVISPAVLVEALCSLSVGKLGNYAAYYFEVSELVSAIMLSVKFHYLSLVSPSRVSGISMSRLFM